MVYATDAAAALMFTPAMPPEAIITRHTLRWHAA